MKEFTVKVFTSACILFFGGQIMAATLPNQMVYIVVVNTIGCVCDVRVNDVPIEQNADGMPVDVDIPINHYLAHGANNFQIRISPLLGDESISPSAECSATMKVRKVGGSNEDARVVDALSYFPQVDMATDAVPDARDEQQSVSLKREAKEEGGVIFESQPYIDTGIPLWKWIDSDVITVNDNTKQELFQQYQLVWNLIKKGSFRELESIFDERTREITSAFYAKPGQVAPAERISDIANNEPEMELYSLDIEDAELEVFGNGRLMRLARWDGSPLLVFTDGDVGEYFDMIYRKEGEQWIVTR